MILTTTTDPSPSPAATPDRQNPRFEAGSADPLVLGAAFVRGSDLLWLTNGRSAMRADPRSPFVLNTHELGRRPGSMRTLELSVRAPTDLGIELLGVPEGSPLD